MMDQGTAPQEMRQAGAVARMGEALAMAGFSRGQLVLNGFGPAYALLDALAREALRAMGAQSVTGEQLLGDPSLAATGFVGSPDRLFTLCQGGYGAVLTHALVGGGAVFPLVHGVADSHQIALCDIMSADEFGPFGARTAREGAYMLLDGVDIDLLRPGGEQAVALGMVGEIVLSDDTGSVRTGVLSAFEQVPHRYRVPGLQGWMGFAVPTVRVNAATVRDVDLATLVREHEEVLDARLLMHPESVDAPVLQVETEAGDWIEGEIGASFEALTGLRAQVERVTPGWFGRSGRVFGRKAA